jgi:16S rRNA (guanine966-N2)-methyltransferase
MRIISGQLKGRNFASPRGHKTHPMSDKMRGALFNILGDIEGLSFLDAFSGSGALAFEAASRGAKEVLAIEKDRAAYSITEINTKELHLQELVHVIRANTAGWSIHNMERQFDIVLMDPPYDDVQLNLLQKLINRHVKKNGLAVLSYPGGEASPEFERAEAVENKNYGDSQLVFYRKTK